MCQLCEVQINQQRADAFTERLVGAMWGRETADRMLAEAGLEVTTFHRLPHDIHNAYWISQRKAKQ